MNNQNHTGKVIIAGAGPGDPELITVKAANYLQQADVVLTDRLVSRVILDRYVRPNARIIEVGKQCRKGISTPQETINELITRFALEGNLVVRLKGGDISFFSNILDELQALKAAGISYEIIPGITAASGAAAYAGIPLTARGYANAVRFLTFYRPDIISDDQWRSLAETEDTLVFYMSSDTIDGLVTQLKKNGIQPTKKLAVLEQATTTYQQVYVSSLEEYETNVKGRTFLSPSLIVIGNVVELHEQFNWFSGSDLQEYYFKPLTSPVKELTQEPSTNTYAGRA